MADRGDCPVKKQTGLLSLHFLISILVILANASDVNAGEVAGCYGRIGVIQVFPESSSQSSNSETWELSRIVALQDEVLSALEYWSAKAFQAGETLTFVSNTRYVPLIDAEPIEYGETARCNWIHLAMESLNYADFFLDCDDEVRKMNEHHESILNTDYNFTVFIADNHTSRETFQDGSRAFTVPRAYIVSLYNVPVYGVANFDWVLAHETGHICGAPDEYEESACNCNQCNNLFCNLNCEKCTLPDQHVECLMRELTSELVYQNLCYYTQGMVGWNEPALFDLTIQKSGDGRGYVETWPTGISCGQLCSAQFYPGFVVTLMAEPALGSTFAGWTGACSGVGECIVVMLSDTEIGAVFKDEVVPVFPSITTSPATSVGLGEAQLSLSVNPNGTGTTAWFQWGLSENSLPEQAPVPVFGVGSGETAVLRSYTLAGLGCDTRYYYQAWADGYGPAVSGEVLSFRTDDCAGGGEGDANDIVVNGDFASDGSHWDSTGYFQADDRFNSYRSYPGYAYLAKLDGGWGDSIAGELYQEVTIPSDAESATLEYWYWVSTNELSGSPPRDVMTVSIRDGGGSFLKGLDSYSNNDAYGGGYRSDEFNVSEFIGDTIRVHFIATTSSTHPTVFRLDDISLIVTYDDGGRSDGFDLRAFSPEVDDTTPTLGDRVRFSLSTTNVGDEQAPDGVPVTYYLNGTAVAFDSEETALEPGEIDGEAESFFVPDTPGIYYAWACLAVYSEELNTTNNCTDDIPLMVAEDPTEGPDVVIINTTTSKTTLLVGETFDMTATVKNVGNKSLSANSLVRFLAALGDSLDNDALLLEADTVSWLSVGQERVAHETMQGPLEPGTYLLGACVNVLGDEIDENNNCSPDPFILQVLPNGCQPETVSVTGLAILGTEEYEACQTIEAGPSTSVETGGSLELHAPRVVFYDGFRVLSGGKLKVQTDQPLSSISGGTGKGTREPAENISREEH